MKKYLLRLCLCATINFNYNSSTGSRKLEDPRPLIGISHRYTNIDDVNAIDYISANQNSNLLLMITTILDKRKYLFTYFDLSAKHLVKSS